MLKIDDAAILKRAKEFCEQNGTRWDADSTPVKAGGRVRRVLDEAGRRGYLARAREQLLNEYHNSLNELAARSVPTELTAPLPPT
jgi:hypothetical protein